MKKRWFFVLVPIGLIFFCCSGFLLLGVVRTLNMTPEERAAEEEKYAERRAQRAVEAEERRAKREIEAAEREEQSKKAAAEKAAADRRFQDEKKLKGTEYRAKYAAKEHVLTHLLSTDGAKVEIISVLDKEDGSWFLVGEVTSKNAFGVKITKRWAMTLRYKPAMDDYGVEACSLDEE